VGYEDADESLTAYVGNDPINMVDPTGELLCLVHCWAGLD